MDPRAGGGAVHLALCQMCSCRARASPAHLTPLPMAYLCHIKELPILALNLLEGPSNDEAFTSLIGNQPRPTIPIPIPLSEANNLEFNVRISLTFQSSLSTILPFLIKSQSLSYSFFWLCFFSFTLLTLIVPI